MKNNLVSIATVKNDMRSALAEVLSPLGGLSSMIKKGDIVLIKPNFVAPRAHETGATTNLELVENITQEIHRCGGRPMLFEVPAIEQKLETVYEVLKIEEFTQKNGMEIYNWNDDMVKVDVPSRHRKLQLPALTQSAKIINIPKLKTHIIATLSAAMKNLFGFLPESERRKMHIWGIHRAIFDLNTIIKPMLNIVDATTCMEGDGPVYGDNVTLNLLIAGKNTAAVDKVCCTLVGIDPKDVGYLKLVLQRSDDFEVNISGVPMSFPVKKFRLPNSSTTYRLLTRLSFALDAIWMRVAGRTLTGMIYSAGYMGTRPYFDWDLCNQCEQCLTVCPVKDALDVQERVIDYNQCIRCLNCIDVCPLNAILVKGLTKPE